jgi:ABC-2 type transport system permease protein
MRNTFLIARREYLEKVRTKAFIIMTILVPAIMYGLTVGPALIAARNLGGTKRLVVVASDARTGQLIRLQIERRRQEEKKQKEQAEKNTLPRRSIEPAAAYAIEVDTNTSEAERGALTEKVKAKQLDGVIWATADALAARKVSYITRDVAGITENLHIEDSVTLAVQREALKGKGLSDGEIESIQKEVELSVESASGGKRADFRSTMLTLVFLTTVLYVSVLLYGINVMNAVLEEKNSRVMEVMLASSEPKELMAGKILGVGAVGLTQIGLWTLAGAALSSPGLIAGGGELKHLITPAMAIAFPVFFLLGYTLYSTLYATIGAMVNSQQEGQQFQQLIALPLALSFIFIFSLVQYPNSPLALALSFFPLTSPLMMFARIAIETPPWWQIALSIAILVGSIYGIVLVCAKIYRVGILMYGKKPTLPEIVKWIKYA